MNDTDEALFSENSYGFRLGRKAPQAVLKAQEYIREGYEWVVDIDLEKFFDKVNHDILMSRVARKVKDKKILLLIRKFLQAGVMENGLVQVTEEGTPQGGLCKALHKEALCLRYFQTLCLMTLIKNWKREDCALQDMRMTAIST